MAAGRPTTYTKELGDKICKRIASGESVRSIDKDKKMPSGATIYNWLLDENKREFFEQYARARSIQAEIMFEELLEIADDGSNDWMTLERRDGTEIELENKEVVNRSRLRVDTRKWYLSKVLPKKFGDKLDLTSGGDKLPTPILPLNATDNGNNKDNGA